MTYILVKNDNWTAANANDVAVDIPSDWKITPLSDSVTKANRGQSPTYVEESTSVVTSQKCLSTYKFNILKARPCMPMKGERGHFLPGDVLLASTGEGTLGKCAIADVEGYCDSHVSVIRFSYIDSGYLFHTWVRKNFEYVNNQWASGGTKQTELKLKNVLSHEWLEPPLAEQTAIANILSDQEALVAHYNDLIGLHEKRFAYLSDELLSGRLRLSREVDGPVTISQNVHWHSLSINENECSTPEDWHVENVSGLGYGIVTGKKDANAAVSGGAYTFFTCGEKDLAIDVYSFDTEALILNGNGNVGEVKMANGKFDAYQRNYVLTGGLPLKYGYYVFKHYFKDAVNLSGSVMPYITLKDLQKFDIRVPPLEEQTLIANILSDQEALIAEYKKLRDAEKKRFDWLSDALLSGTYRVKMEA